MCPRQIGEQHRWGVVRVERIESNKLQLRLKQTAVHRLPVAIGRLNFDSNAYHATENFSSLSTFVEDNEVSTTLHSMAMIDLLSSHLVRIFLAG